jgi:hypothetical protein
VVIAMTIFVVLHFRRRAGNHRRDLEGIVPDDKVVVSNGKLIYAIKTKYMTYMDHSDLPDPQSSSLPDEWISHLSPYPLEMTPSSSATPQATRPSAQTPPPSKFVILYPPTTDPAIPVPLASISPQLSGFTTHPASSENSNLGPPSGLSTNATDEEEALILRLCNLHVSPADITRVIAITSGREESTVEEARLLRRLYNLNVPAEDINLIVSAMQRRDIERDADPPGYGVEGRLG